MNMINWRDPVDDPPKWTGKILVWTSNGPEIVRIEETFMQYSSGEPAAYDEWIKWAEVNKPIL